MQYMGFNANNVKKCEHTPVDAISNQAKKNESN